MDLVYRKTLISVSYSCLPDGSCELSSSSSQEPAGPVSNVAILSHLPTSKESWDLGNIFHYCIT